MKWQQGDTVHMKRNIRTVAMGKWHTLHAQLCQILITDCSMSYRTYMGGAVLFVTAF